jgi:hypothetical protein
VNVYEACRAVRAITPDRLAGDGEKWVRQLEQDIKRSISALETFAAESEMETEHVPSWSTEQRVSL